MPAWKFTDYLAYPGANRVATSGLIDRWLDPSVVWLAVAAHLRTWVVAHWPVAGSALLAGVTAVMLAHRWRTSRRHTRLATEARQVTVLAPPTVDPAGGVAVWANLVGLLRPAWPRWLSGQPHLAWEYVFSQTGVAIRMWVPRQVAPHLVERAIEAAWPGAHTATGPAEAPLPAPDSGQRRVVVAGLLRLARTEGLPIRTQFDADPIRAILGAPVGLGRGEHACVQIVARPVAGHRVTRAHTASHASAEGAARPVRAVATGLLDVLTPGPVAASRAPARHRAGHDPRTLLASSAADRAVVDKQRGPQYETVIRYAVAVLLPATASDDEVRRARQLARGRAHALASAFARYSEHNRYARKRLRHAGTVLAQRRLTRGDLLSVPELAALAHLPTDTAIPGVRRAGARAIAPPPGVAVPGPHAKPLGLSDAGQARPIGLRVPDARYHLHVLGATGSGKSTLLAHLILDDATAGRGVIVVDPKGDLVTDLLARLPRRVADRVVLFDADSRTRPPVLNPLDGDNPDRDVDNLISVFRRVYSAFWGPRTDDVMRAACLTLRGQPGVASLADLPRLLAEPAFRARITAGITDPVLAGFWSWYEELTDATRSQVISPLMNKLRAFLLRPFVRHAITAGPSTVDMGAVLDGGICLVRIPKGSLGEETTRLVGSLVVARTWQATTARARLPQHRRRDAHLVVDECHNFLNLPYPIEDMLAEARGFHLAMTLAHQHLGQLPRELREGISTNARSKVVFTASPEDARDLARHVTPALSDHDLAHLGVFHAAVRLMVHGEQAPPFTITTQPLPRAIPGRAREIRTLAHRTACPGTARPAPPRQSSRPTARGHSTGGATRPRPATARVPHPAPADPRRWPSA